MKVRVPLAPCLFFGVPFEQVESKGAVVALEDCETASAFG
jgi:hypothetical protein